MANFTVLGDADIKKLLLHLSKEEVKYFLQQIEECLADYTSGKEREYQPNAGVINRPEGSKILFRPFTSPDTVGAKIIVHGAIPSESGDQATGTAGGKVQQGPLHGGIVLCDKSGHPIGFLNAEEVTGYRTTLSAMIPFMLRRQASNILIFGAGKQALWHTRLALALRGEDIASITIVNRSAPRAEALLKTVQNENNYIWKSGTQFHFLNSSGDQGQQQLHSALAKADVIFCTVGSKEPLFTLDALSLDERGSSLPLITAVGSWQPDMIEVHPEILHHIVQSRFTEDQKRQGLVLVDDIEASLSHSGEVVQSGLTADQLFEVGHILKLRTDSALSKKQINRLSEGFIVYKSIGVSLTDLAAGNAILVLAERNNMGTKISNF